MKQMRRFEQALWMGGLSLQAEGEVRMLRETIAGGTPKIPDGSKMFPVRRSSCKEEYCMARSCVGGRFL